ncbi:P-loop containing nucleoside triphosphate hydrolase protein [Aaosphaeria arxii CBS 175.79]|uniref:DNA 3'-5' helicase n=1 Tax=Aaosphaeria arxii CBS 175.79 TaxID=1450172 RepID=A0A6A5X8W6_9PLEO|nr:P-loop containing nucleoside triphosphate hydrolase protein [Aaosphaeria arxii CBS 175.79]KAF2009326.1 P-loop containing nucleoside triphosphate hydrolase protein [Aaosphaeria arxii CBS 175.79]
MDELLDGLNDAQSSAVTSRASVLQVLAPPGSGKTKTLTARVAYLVAREGFKPCNIIVCTFTLKAAREMKDRIRGMLGHELESKLILGTFHSVARRFLVRYGHEIGIKKDFGIADTTDSKAMIKRIIARNNYSIEPDPARSRISGLKAKGTTAEQFAATSNKAHQHELARIYSEYQETLKASNLLDYDDLLLRCTELLSMHPTCVCNIEAVLIDEYQDTNNVQYQLMALFAQKLRRITIVGDPDQSIYGFRSAEIKNLYRMREDYTDTVVINLEKNYRSAGNILLSAQAVIEQDQSRPSKLLVPTHCIGIQPTLRHLFTKDVEARWIVEEIERSRNLTAGVLNYGDYAILLRTSTLSMSIEKALAKAGIPYKMVGGRRFFDRAEIRIVLDYLRVINQPDHNDALIRVINVPTRKIGDVTIKALLDEAETGKMTLWSLILGYAQGKRRPRTKIATQAQKGIDAFVNLILTSRRKLLPENGEQCNLFDLIAHILKRLSFQAYLKGVHKDNWEERWDNVNELATQASQMASASIDDSDMLPVVEGIEQRQDTAADILSKFLANVALATEVEKPDGEDQQQVTISTIHAAKGLEWPAVFIPGVYDGSIPHSRAEDHDEERRLLYVGMTRAQGLLYLSCPHKQSSSEETTVSKFVSTSRMLKLFSPQGPTFCQQTIRDLGGILARPCPTMDLIEAARTNEEWAEDIRYPLTRMEMDGDGSSGAWSNPHLDDARSKCLDVNVTVQQPYKRRRLDSSGPVRTYSASTTMQSSYSVANTTLTATLPGFTTASAVKSSQDRLAEEAKAFGAVVPASTAAAGKSVFSQVTKAGTDKSGPKPPKVRSFGQGTITNFFSKSSMVRTEPVDPSSQLSTTHPLLSHSQSLSMTTAPSNKIALINSTSSSNVARKPLNVPMIGRPRKLSPEPYQDKRYILLSSSPTKPDDHAPCGPSSSNGDKGSIVEPVNPVQSTMHRGFSAVKPAVTLHDTSTGHPKNSSGSSRRALGMRKAMQPWSVKHRQPPCPRR